MPISTGTNQTGSSWSIKVLKILFCITVSNLKYFQNLSMKLKDYDGLQKAESKQLCSQLFQPTKSRVFLTFLYFAFTYIFPSATTITIDLIGTTETKFVKTENFYCEHFEVILQKTILLVLDCHPAAE